MSNLNSNLLSNMSSGSDSVPTSPTKRKEKSATKVMKDEKKAIFQERSARIKELLSGIPIIFKQLAALEEHNKVEVEKGSPKSKWVYELSSGKEYILDKTAVKEYLEKISREVTLLEKDANSWVTAKGSRTSANTKPIMYLESFINFLAGANLGPYVPIDINDKGLPDKKNFKNLPFDYARIGERLNGHLISLIPGVNGRDEGGNDVFVNNPFYKFIAPATVQSLISLAMHYDPLYAPIVPNGAQGGKPSEKRVILSQAMREQLGDVLRRSIIIDAEKVYEKLSDRATNEQKNRFRGWVDAARENALANLADINETLSTRVGDTDEVVFNPNYAPAFNKVKMLEGAKDEDNKYSFLNPNEFASIQETFNNARSERERMNEAYLAFLNPNNYNNFVYVIKTLEDNDTLRLFQAYQERYLLANNPEAGLGDFLREKMVSIALNNQTTLIKMASDFRTWSKEQFNKEENKKAVAKSKEVAVEDIRRRQAQALVS